MFMARNIDAQISQSNVSDWPSGTKYIGKKNKHKKTKSTPNQTAQNDVSFIFALICIWVFSNIFFKEGYTAEELQSFLFFFLSCKINSLHQRTIQVLKPNTWIIIFLAVLLVHLTH